MRSPLMFGVVCIDGVLIIGNVDNFERIGNIGGADLLRKAQRVSFEFSPHDPPRTTRSSSVVGPFGSTLGDPE